MQFPRTLNANGRKKLNEKKILSFHYMYARHKAVTDWKEGDEFPDYNKIKVNQSFNWSAFSYPVWARFIPGKKYMSNYGIMRYKVHTIKNIHKHSKILPEKSFDIKHEPEDENYSHCELNPINIQIEHKTKDRKNRREFRYILSRYWDKKLNPFEEPSQSEIRKYFITLLFHRISIYINFLFKQDN